MYILVFDNDKVGALNVGPNFEPVMRHLLGCMNGTHPKQTHKFRTKRACATCKKRFTIKAPTQKYCNKKCARR